MAGGVWGPDGKPFGETGIGEVVCSATLSVSALVSRRELIEPPPGGVNFLLYQLELVSRLAARG